jgi:hypothetical protein
MSRVKIDRDDANRILLTEILPYEVPMLFSNDGFYSIVSSNKHVHFFDKLRRIKERFGIPFNYEIAKSNNSDTRLLSIIHPINQLPFVEFYKKYDSIIIHLCSKSPFSLRKVTKVAKFCYSPDLVIEEDEHQNAEVEVEPDVLDFETKIFKSYFIYKPIDLIYKFYERNEYQRLEQRFNFLWEFDISKCFYHIYTHSITWAVKDKETAKKNKSHDSFENKFDELMQQSNYNETNGILVGPEVSRIFAEIILQEVDLHVLKSLDSINLKFGVDYEIRRYVDDFFVFANDEKVLDSIFKTYRKELEFYKLYINPSKTEKRSTPFITNIAVGKRQVKKLVQEVFNEIIESSDSNEDVVKAIKLIKNPYSLSQSFIKDFQCIVKQNNLTYDVLNKDVVRLLKRELVSILKDKKLSKDKHAFESFLLMYLDITFYCYSLNINASVTFKVAQIIVLITKFSEDKSEEFKHTVFSKIAREAEFVMTTYHRKTKVSETNIETLNLLIALKKLGTGYLVTEKKIREYFNLQRVDGDTPAKEVERFTRLNYFQIITLLYYFGDNTDYERIKKIVEKAVVKKFQMEGDPFNKAEFTCLFFDFICCPFVDIESKKKVIRHSKYPTTDIEGEISKIEEPKMWFMNWDPEIDLERVLKKKEWSSSY